MPATLEANTDVDQDREPDNVLEQPAAVARIEYPVAMTVIADLKLKYGELTIACIDDKVGIKAVDEARKEVKRLKIQVENRRKELKADALEYGRKVDAAAKQLSEPLEALEASLAGKQKLVTDEIAKIEQQKADELFASRRDRLAVYGAEVPERILRIMREDEFNNALCAAQSAHEDKLRRDAEEAEKAELQRAENERLEAERKKLETERQELEKAKQEQADREAEAQRKIEQEQARLEKLEADRLAAIEQEREEAETAEAIRLADEEHAKFLADQAKLKAEQEEADRVRAESLRPDKDKLNRFARQVASLEVPDVGPDARLVRSLIVNRLLVCSEEIQRLIEARLK